MMHLAQSIGLTEEAIQPELPIVYGSTGIWTLLIQGQELGKDGRVHVHVKNDKEKLNISITGTAVHVKDLKVQI